MNDYDLDDHARNARLQQLVDELTPRIRRVCPDMPDPLFAAMVRRMAGHRLVDERLRTDEVRSRMSAASGVLPFSGARSTAG